LFEDHIRLIHGLLAGKTWHINEQTSNLFIQRFYQTFIDFNQLTTIFGF